MPPHPSNPPSNDPSCHPAVAALRLASQWMAGGRKLQRALATALAPLGLGESELLILLAIDDRIREETEVAANLPDQKQLAHELGLSPALVSQLVESMRRRTWIAGTRHPDDRRRQIWQMTPAGRELLTQALDLLVPWAIELQQAAFAERAVLDRLAALASRVIPTTGAVDAELPIVSLRGDAA